MLKKFNLKLSILLLIFFSNADVFAQIKSDKKLRAQVVHSSPSLLLTTFNQTIKQANVEFTPPRGFKEIEPVNNEYFTFDYAMKLPHDDFEVWYMVRSQKGNWNSYDRVKTDEALRLANPDSIYIQMANANAIALTGERNSFTKTLPKSVLKRYNADAGRSYMLNLLNMPETKRYRYALLLSFQKFRTGTIMMVCFTNERKPDFFRNVERAGHSLNFKSSPKNVNKLAY